MAGGGLAIRGLLRWLLQVVIKMKDCIMSYKMGDGAFVNAEG